MKHVALSVMLAGAACLALAAGCDERARSDLETTGSGGGGGSPTSDAGSGGSTPGAVTGTGGSAGSAAIPETWVMLNDFEGDAGSWLFLLKTGDQSTVQIPKMPTTPARDGSPTSVHLDAQVPEGGMDLLTHHHVDLRHLFSGVRFWARRGPSGPAELLVGLTGLAVLDSSYEADRAAGTAWLVRRVPLTEEWQQITVRWSDLSSQVAGGVGGNVVPTFSAMGSALHFIVESGQQADLWIDDLEAGCVTATCAPRSTAAAPLR